MVAHIRPGPVRLALEPEGYPYGSSVTVAFDNGNPIFLISGLAEHTKKLEWDIVCRRWWPREALQIARQRPRHHPRTVRARRRGSRQRACRIFAAHRIGLLR